MSGEGFDVTAVDAWLAPLADGAEPCGRDWEYDNEFLELNKAAQGKPETQFGPGEPPNWREVRVLSEALMDKTRDLRVALLWMRAAVNMNGFAAFPVGLRLIEGLLTQFWDHVHPLPDPDDGDPYARLNALSILPQADGLLGDLRQSVLFQIRGVGELRLRTIEVGLGLLPAKTDEAVLSRDQLSQMVLSAEAHEPDLRVQLQAAQDGIARLSDLLNQQFGVVSAPDMRPVSDLVKCVQSLFPSSTPLLPEAELQSAVSTGNTANTGLVVPMSGQVQSREDALRAIDLICEYLDRTEPTNPAQLLLRRARRLINQNFLQLMKELAPEALNEVARVMGVNPDSVTLDD